MSGGVRGRRQKPSPTRSKKLLDFNKDYMRLTKQVADSCMNYDLPEYMVIGTSAIVNTEIDGAVGMNSGILNNPCEPVGCQL